MTPEQILAIPPRVLTQAQREFYFQEGYILLERIIGDEWVAKLRDATEELVERSRKVTRSDAVFDLEPDHRPSAPRLRRVSATRPSTIRCSGTTSTSRCCPTSVADLVGPDVKFHHSKLNFKWSKGGEEVKWHYDISFWPHTNYSPLTVGTYLYDCGMDQGPLGVIPQSHRIEPMLTQYDDAARWVGCLRDARRRDARHLEGGLPARAGRLADAAQLPHDARFAAQRLRPRPAAAALHADVGRRVPVHRATRSSRPTTRRSFAASARHSRITTRGRA